MRFIGALLGNETGGIVTQWATPRWSFFIYSLLMLIMTALSTRLSKAMEKDEAEILIDIRPS